MFGSLTGLAVYCTPNVAVADCLMIGEQSLVQHEKLRRSLAVLALETSHRWRWPSALLDGKWSHMVAYVIVEAKVLDEQALNDYGSIAKPSILQYGGRYLVFSLDGAVALEGLKPNGIAVVEFPTIERLKEWYASPEYAPALKLMPKALDRRMICVEGLPPA
jgi:uncharacterized protein (DUF1330 family)